MVLQMKCNFNISVPKLVHYRLNEKLFASYINWIHLPCSVFGVFYRAQRMLEARASTSKAQKDGLYLLLFYRIDIGHGQGKIEVKII